jgi:hypothetical protein
LAPLRRRDAVQPEDEFDQAEDPNFIIGTVIATVNGPREAQPTPETK